MDGVYFLDPGSFDEIISIHGLKLGSYKKTVEKCPIFGLVVSLSSNSPGILYIHQNNALV